MSTVLKGVAAAMLVAASITTISCEEGATQPEPTTSDEAYVASYALDACLDKFSTPAQAAIRAELREAIDTRMVSLSDCERHGEYLESIRSIESSFEDSLPADNYGEERFQGGER